MGRESQRRRGLGFASRSMRECSNMIHLQVPDSVVFVLASVLVAMARGSFGALLYRLEGGGGELVPGVGSRADAMPAPSGVFSRRGSLAGGRLMRGS